MGGGSFEGLFRRLGCWCHRPPSEPTFRRFLQSVDADEVDKLAGEWLAAQAEAGVTCSPISLDGKTLPGSRDGDRRAWHLLAAITHETGTVLAQEKVEEKSNEITGAKPLLEGVDLRGHSTPKTCPIRRKGPRKPASSAFSAASTLAHRPPAPWP